MKTNNLVKILLVDDLPENLFALELILADKNYSFVKANSGNEALKILLREQDFVIILMDVQMPEMDGFETVELIREIETLKHVPVIFLTASMDNANHIFKGYQTGGVDYMIKPLIPEILIAKVAVFVELYLKTHELLAQNEEKEKRAAELVIANKELIFQDQEKGKRANELIIVNKELALQNKEKEKQTAELIIANKELIFQNEEKKKRVKENEELEVISNAVKQTLLYSRSLIEASLDPFVTISPEGKITDVNEASVKVTGVPRLKLIGTDFSDYFTEPQKAREGYKQVFEKEFVSDYPLTIHHKNGTLTDVLYNASVYKDDKGNVLGIFAAARDITAQKAEELSIANKELILQNKEKEKQAAILEIANIELKFQNDEKEKRAAELIIANEELAFQNDEKERRAAKLIIANKELAFQNEEKEKRAAELIIANKELAFQNDEKEKRAAELIIANKELAFQNDEKEKRAAELIIANKELAFQNDEKEKRAAKLVIANKELLFQNDEKEKQAAELINANKELESFNYISSHDLQEPLRKIQIFSNRLIADESQNLSDKGKEYVLRIEESAKRMRTLIDDLLAYSRTTSSERKFKTTSLTPIIEAVKDDFKEIIIAKQATIESGEMCDAHVITFQFYQLIHNLIGNALKFSNPDRPPHITINSRNIKGNKVKNQKLLSEKEYCHITVTDNGIGFAPQYKDHIFEIFKRLHGKEKISGTGIGLTIVKKIVENHNGVIIATGELNKGASFDIYIPSN
jgi:PAS domain S-box-containing protein